MYSKRDNVLQWMKDRCEPYGGTVETERKTRIRWHDRWVRTRSRMASAQLTPEATVDCLDGYIEAYVKRRMGEACPENFGDWIDWRMGAGFAEHFMVPYNQKIWKCDLREMSSGWVAGRVPEAPIRDILVVCSRPHDRGLHPPVGVLVPSRRGLRDDGPRRGARRRLHAAHRHGRRERAQGRGPLRGQRRGVRPRGQHPCRCRRSRARSRRSPRTCAPTSARCSDRADQRADRRRTRRADARPELDLPAVRGAGGGEPGDVLLELLAEQCAGRSRRVHGRGDLPRAVRRRRQVA
jgi:hypothetical protein